ncbi:MFS transporter [Vibrio sp. PP-XX7]
MIQLTRALYVLLFATFTNYIGFVVPMFLSLYLHKDGQSLAVIGYTLTAYGFGGFLGGFAGGIISDKTSPYSVIVGSLLVSTSALIAIYVTSGIASLIILLLVFGFSDHSFRPALTMLLVNNTIEEKRTFVFGLRSAVMNISIGISAAVGALVLEYSMKDIFLFDAMFNVITLFLILAFASKMNRSNVHSHPENAYEDEEKEPNRNSKAFLALSGLLVINAIVFSQSKTTFVLYIREALTFNAKTISYLFILNTIIIIFVEVPLISMTSKLNQIKTMLFGSVALGLGFSFVAIYDSPYIPFLSVVTWTVGEMLFFPIILNEFIKTSTKHRGKVVGWHQTLFATGTFLGSPVGIFLYQFNGGNLVWVMCAIVGTLSLIAFTFSGILGFSDRKVKIAES